MGGLVDELLMSRAYVEEAVSEGGGGSDCCDRLNSFRASPEKIVFADIFVKFASCEFDRVDGRSGNPALLAARCVAHACRTNAWKYMVR